MAREFHSFRIKYRWLQSLLLLLLISHAHAQAENIEQDLLQPDAAFAFSSSVTNRSTLQATWDIADGYYLYRDRIRFSTDTPDVELGEPVLPNGQVKNDAFFGKIDVFRNQVTATIPITRAPDDLDNMTLRALSQGCADIGVCYPPHTQVAQLNLTLAPAAAAPAPVPDDTGTDTLQALQTLDQNLGLNSPDDEFLDPDDAFRATLSEAGPDELLIRWDIAEGYYLYRDKLDIRLLSGDGVTAGPASIPQGEIKHDEFFGDVQVFHHEVEASLPLQRASGAAMEVTVQLGYQGCAEAGICYPPIKKQLTLSLAAFNPDDVETAASLDADATPGVASGSTQDKIARELQKRSLVGVVLFFFGAGLLLAFTACMYPMIPILSSVIVGHGNSVTAGSAFLLSLVYVEAVAVTYAIIGLVSAQLGAGVQAFFQNPWILGGFALVFVALAMSMFGFFHLQLPASLQARLSQTSHRMKGGSLVGVAVMGVLSALIVGPCAGPVIIGALIYTSQSGDYLTGALAMFALGNGMGAPLLVICTSGGKLLPKAGMWMNTVKAVFGVILLGVAILMLERILPGSVTLTLWALLLIIPAIYMRALDALPEGASGWQRFWKGLGVAMLVYGVILILGAATGARDPLNPLRNLNTSAALPGTAAHTSRHLQFQRIKNIADLEQAMQASSAAGKPAMLDFYADWCTYCIKMEDDTFSDPAVQAALAGVTLLQADVTANDAEDLALLNHFNLFAPPAILFFDAAGRELDNARLVGFLDADEFLEHVQGAFGGGK
jgi:thiol:disulfide interchange protein DsbD